MAGGGSRLWLEIYYFLTGYGERPLHTATVSGIVILLFALIYYVFNCISYSIENPAILQKIIESMYFSFVTFTILGLGDIHPLTNLGRMLICCEAVIGAFLIALFVVVFVRKMAR